MQKTRTLTVAAAATLATVALIAMSTPNLDARGQARPGRATTTPVGGEAFSADLTMRQARVGPDGQSAGPAAPSATVRMTRRLQGGRWRTTLTLQHMDRPEIRGLATSAATINPFEVVRFEYDEDGTAPRMYDRHGRLVRLPGGADRRRLHTPAAIAAGLPVLESPAGRVPPPVAFAGQDFAAAVLAPPTERAARRTAIERQLGRPTGQVRGLNRHVAWMGTDTLEVLVDPDMVVPVEINRMRHGELVARTGITQVRDAAGTLVRRMSRTERVVDGASGERMVTEIELANIQVTSVGGAL
jgi:hypothetical protein